MREAEIIAREIRERDTWSDDLNRQLCEMAGLLDQYEEADGESFEAVVESAAEKLGVSIY